MKTNPTHVVLARPLATGRWEILEYAQSAESALDKASQQRDGLSYGDLILAIDMAEISAIPERGKCLYFVDSASAVVKAPVVPALLNQSTWFLGWEGPGARADDLLAIASGIGNKKLMTISCVLARRVLLYGKIGKDQARIAIETTEAYMRGEVSSAQLTDAVEAMWNTVARPLTDIEYALYSAAAYATEGRANAVAFQVAVVMPGDVADNLRQLSHIVREYIPLHVVLESRV